MMKPEDRPSFWLLPLIPLLLALALPVLAREPRPRDVEARYEPPPVLRASQILPPGLLKGPYHTTAEAVPTEGHFFRFDLQSHYGRYRVVSLEMLKIRVNEVAILARAVALKDEYEFLRAAAGRIQATGEALVGTVIHPVETAKAVGRGIGEKVLGVARLFKGRKRSKRRDPLLKELLIAKHKRQVAHELNVDVYSSNPQIQDLLDSIASQRAVGQAAVDLGAIFVPGAAGIVVSVGKFGANMKSLIRDKSPGELADLNDEKLEAMGIQPELRKLFINHTEYSPRHQTFLVGALGLLGGVENRGAFLQAALHASSEAEALYYQKAAELLASYHRRDEPLRRLERADAMPAAITKSGKVILIAPFDYGYWDARVERALLQARKLAEACSAPSKEIVIPGSLSPRTRQISRSLGFVAREGFQASI